MFGLLPIHVPTITVEGNGYNRTAVIVDGERFEQTPGVGGCRMKFILRKFGLIVKLDNAGADANGQWNLYHEVDAQDQPYFSVPVAKGNGWIAEALYDDFESIDYSGEEDDEVRALAEELAMKYDITDWCLSQSKKTSTGHLIIHDYARDDACEACGYVECECEADYEDEPSYGCDCSICN